MALESLTEARELWGSANDFWTLFKDRQAITHIWQGLVERIDELSKHEDAVADYSIEDILATETRLWDTIDNVDNAAITDADGVAIPGTIVSIPYLQDFINSTGNTYVEDTDYVIIVETQKLAWIAAQPADTYLFAPEVILENALVEQYFNSGFFDIVLDNFNYLERRELLRLIWHISKHGPTKFNLKSITHALSGIPFNKYPAIVKVGGIPRFTLHYQIPVYAFTHDDNVYLASEKNSHSAVVISSNKLTNMIALISVNDHVLIGGIYYRAIEVIGNDILLDKTISDDTLDIVVYVDFDKIISTNCALFDNTEKRAYSIRYDGTYPEYILYLVHQKNIGYNDDNDAYVILATETKSAIGDGELAIDFDSELAIDVIGSAELATDGTEGLTYDDNVSDGDIIAAFTNLQKIYTITGWEDNYIDPLISGYDAELMPNLIKSIYNVEVDRAYSIKTVVDSTHITLDSVGDIVAADGLVIRNTISDKIYDVDSKELDDDGFWILTTGDDYPYRGMQTIRLIKEMVDGGDTYHIGGTAIIIEGTFDYVADKYKLKVDMDLSDGEYSAGLKIVIIEPFSHTRIIDGIIGTTCELEAETSLSTAQLPVIQKAPLANYGNYVIRDLSVNAIKDDKVVIIAAPLLEDGELYNYILIYGDSIEAELHEVDEILGATITLKDDLVHTYTTTDNSHIILLKRLPLHGGITIKYYDAAGDYTQIEVKYTNIQANVAKILTMLLPSGYEYRWRAD